MTSKFRIGETMSKHRKALVISGAAILAIAVALMLSRCSAQAEGNVEEPTVTTVSLTSSSAASDTGSESSETAATEPESKGSGDDSGFAQQTSDGYATSQASGTTASSQNADATQAASTPSQSSSNQNSGQQNDKRWVEDTEQVWVVDKAAWTEEVPVYSSVEISVCNVCGADISGNVVAHEKAHMLAGEGSGHHSEVHEIISGYETVEHPEVGHWETIVTGGHWE